MADKDSIAPKNSLFAAQPLYSGANPPGFPLLTGLAAGISPAFTAQDRSIVFAVSFGQMNGLEKWAVNPVFSQYSARQRQCRRGNQALKSSASGACFKTSRRALMQLPRAGVPQHKVSNFRDESHCSVSTGYSLAASSFLTSRVDLPALHRSLLMTAWGPRAAWSNSARFSRSMPAFLCSNAANCSMPTALIYSKPQQALHRISFTVKSYIYKFSLSTKLWIRF